MAGKRILVLGASYRQDVGDTRHSPSAILIEALEAEGAKCDVSDPIADEFPEVNRPVLRQLPSAAEFDAIALAVAHADYAKLDIAAWCQAARPLVCDTNGVLGKARLNALKAEGFEVIAIGRGESTI